MRISSVVIVGLAMLTFPNSLTAQQEHPFVTRALEYAVIGQVVADKCSGWSLNPTVVILINASVETMGLRHQVDRVSPSELARRATEAGNKWPSGRIADVCAKVVEMRVPDPLKDGATYPLFIKSRL